MGQFLLGTTDFGIGEITFEINTLEKYVIDLTIHGNETMTNKLSENENGEWSWVIYPPKLYIREVPYTEKNGNIYIDITEDMLDEYDIALYLAEHNDLEGTLQISPAGALNFTGTTFLSGDKTTVEISAKVEL